MHICSDSESFSHSLLTATGSERQDRHTQHKSFKSLPSPHRFNCISTTEKVHLPTAMHQNVSSKT